MSALQLSRPLLNAEQVWLSCSRGLPNGRWLARMLASQRFGHSALPDGLGLAPMDFHALLQWHFPGTGQASAGEPLQTHRRDDFQALERLLLSNRAGEDPSEAWMASIVAQGCLGGDHLWYDLGLWSRDDLCALLASNFPALAEQNRFNMKWKKFLYRLLCAGRYCRSPSCQDCVEFGECFGPES
jgi:nitrogen fixation protein NifQ